MKILKCFLAGILSCSLAVGLFPMTGKVYAAQDAKVSVTFTGDEANEAGFAQSEITAKVSPLCFFQAYESQ